MTMSITKGHTRLIPCSLHSDFKNVQKSALKSVNVQRTGKSILQMFAFSFSEYCRVYEEKEGIKFYNSFDVDKKAVVLPKKVRTIKLDDTAEINLLKTGGFIERGFDESEGLNYYKLYFSKEK